MNPFDSFVLVLGFSSSRLDKDSLSGADMKNEGFAPPGFFSKLIATILSKSTDIACRDQSEILSQHLVIFCYGAQKFRLRHIAALNCVIVDVEGKYALGVLRILEDLAQTVLDECMKTVKSRVFLPVETGPHSSIQQHSLATCAEKMKSEYFILLPVVERAVRENLPLVNPGSRHVLKASEIPANLRKFVLLKILLQLYDCFLSYRWDTADQKLVTLLFEALSLLVIGDELKGIDVFADIKRLQPGRSFVKDFAFALINTFIIIPILTHNALKRMKAADFKADEIDNMLLELILALHVVEINPSKRIYPIMMGNLNPVSGKREPFDWNMLNDIAGEFVAYMCIYMYVYVYMCIYVCACVYFYINVCIFV